MPPNDIQPIDELKTVRDWLRYGVSRFGEAKLVFGHGTDNAVDEAAFLILSALNLPIQSIDPWLDCRLTQAERMRIANLLAARVTSRKPAAYLVNQAWIKGHAFYVDERTIVPRSFIGELLCEGVIAGLLPCERPVARILELCTGSGCLAILAALAFEDAHIIASDISEEALQVARINVANYGLADRISLVQSDLFEAIPQQPFDLIIANPPYVTRLAVEAFPAEYQAEPRLAHLGGEDGLDLVRTILDRAANFLAPEGSLVVEIGQGRDALEAARPELPYLWLDTAESEAEVFMLTASSLASPTPSKPRRSKPK